MPHADDSLGSIFRTSVPVEVEVLIGDPHPRFVEPGFRGPEAQAIRFVPNGQPPPAVTVVNPRWEGNRLAFSFPSLSGAPYTIQFATSLTTGDWQTLTNVVGTGSTVTISDPNSPSSARFYRVESG